MFNIPIEGCFDIASENGNLHIVSRSEGGFPAVFSPDGVELARVVQIGNVRRLALTDSLPAGRDGLTVLS